MKREITFTGSIDPSEAENAEKVLSKLMALTFERKFKVSEYEQGLEMCRAVDRYSLASNGKFSITFSALFDDD